MNFANNLEFYLVFSTIIFVLGLLCALTRKNAIGVFMGVELMLNAAGINFVAFQSFREKIGGGEWLHGHIFSLFIIVLAAIEAAVALAIVLRIFAAKRDINPDHATELRS